MMDRYCMIGMNTGLFFEVQEHHYNQLREWALKDHFRNKQFFCFEAAEDPDAELMLDLAQISVFYISTPENKAAYDRWKETMRKPGWEE